MSDSDCLLVTARLCSPIVGMEAPQLDSLLEYALSLYHVKARPGYKVDRALPAPPQGEIPIPIARRQIGPWLVGACSNPIMGNVHAEGIQHINKRIGVEKAELLGQKSRTVVTTTNSWTKSYRIPLRQRLVDRIAWFAVGNRREVLSTLKRHITFLGQKRSVGNGRIAEWTVDRVEEDYSWFAPSERGPVLMRTLPVGDWLPAGLIGCRANFGGASPPYWHPDRYTEIVEPC